MRIKKKQEKAKEMQSLGSGQYLEDLTLGDDSKGKMMPP